MGDIIELSILPDHKNTFYQVSSGGFVFEVKATVNFAIGLATKPGAQCDYWVGIGHEYNDYCTWIKKDDDGGGKICRTPNLINNAEYRRLWLSWKNGSIQLGQLGDTNPIISYDNTLDLGYVTFSIGLHGIRFGGNEKWVQWRFELPPILPTPIMKPVTGGDMRWVQVTQGRVPDGALIGGHETETLYIIRASHFGYTIPGKFAPSQQVGFICWGSETYEKNTFEVLCGFNYTWVPTSGDRIPAGAVEGGRSERGEKLYIGRVLHNTHLIPGKVQPSDKLCYVPYEGSEINYKEYEILVCPDTKIISANRQFIPFIDDYGSPPASDDENDDNNYVEYNDFD